jgi:hypothetical protein
VDGRGLQGRVGWGELWHKSDGYGDYYEMELRRRLWELVFLGNETRTTDES